MKIFVLISFVSVAIFDHFVCVAACDFIPGIQNLYIYETHVPNDILRIIYSHYSGVKLIANVQVQSFADHKFLILIKNPRFIHPNETISRPLNLMAGYRDLRIGPDEAFQVKFYQYLQQPFLVQTKCGLIKKFFVHRDEPFAVSNVKRKLLHDLQQHQSEFLLVRTSNLFRTNATIMGNDTNVNEETRENHTLQLIKYSQKFQPLETISPMRQEDYFAPDYSQRPIGTNDYNDLDLESISDIFSKYTLEANQIGQQSELGIFPSAAVATDASPCAPIARDVLKEGGTAVDAAIASLVCNGAVHSHSSGLGGGYFMTIFIKAENKTYFLNAKETAPRYATENMFVNTSADSRKGVFSMGVPGQILGHFKAKERFGNPAIPMKRLFEPTIKLCEEGIRVSRTLALAIKIAEPWVRKDGELRKHFINSKTNEILVEGDIYFRQSYANTLRVLANEGYEVFYGGRMGSQILEELHQLGSRITMQDLMEYNIKWQKPQQARLLNGYKMYSSPLPGSGALLESIVKIFEQLDENKKSGDNFPLGLIESFKFAFAQGAKLGDTFESPYKSEMEKRCEEIVSDEWAQTICQKINSMSKTSLDPVFYGENQFIEKNHHGTSHISVLASNGDAVSVTSSINLYFGSGIMSPSTGIIFNGGMDDFSTNPTKPNVYGLLPSKYNLIRPGAQALSSMSPTIITDPQNNVALVIGASGGPTIVSHVASVIIRHLFLGLNIKEAIDYPRIHHQLHPMKVDMEVGFSKEIIKKIQLFGHNVTLFDPYYGKTTQTTGHTETARIQAIAVDPITSIITANNDKRKSGANTGY